MMCKVKILKELSRQITQWKLCDSAEAKYKFEILNELQEFVQELQEPDEEPISKDLEVLAESYAKDSVALKFPTSSPILAKSDIVRAFIVGFNQGKIQTEAEIMAQSMALAHECPQVAKADSVQETTNAKQTRL